MSNVLEKLPTSTAPWMAAAVLMVALFMYWLYAASSSIESGVVAADTLGNGLPAVADTTFAQDPLRYSGRRVLLRPATVADTLGRASVSLELPGRGGYPAVLDRTVLEQGLAVVPGDRVALAGWVYALNDSILDVWSQRNIYSRGNRERLQGFETFFFVDSLDYVYPGEETPETTGQPGGSR